MDAVNSTVLTFALVAAATTASRSPRLVSLTLNGPSVDFSLGALTASSSVTITSLRASLVKAMPCAATHLAMLAARAGVAATTKATAWPAKSMRPPLASTGCAGNGRPKRTATEGASSWKRGAATAAVAGCVAAVATPLLAGTPAPPSVAALSESCVKSATKPLPATRSRFSAASMPA